MAKVKKLHLERNTLLSRVTKITTFLGNFNDNDDLNYFNARIEKFDNLWDLFNDVQQKIELLAINSEDTDLLQKELDIREEFEATFYDAKAHILNIKDRREKCDVKCVKIQNEGNQIKSNKIRLPDVKIPDFYGDYKQWLPFRDLYNSIIHNNDSLDNVTKFQYLVSYLKGEAGRTIASIQITDDNYQIVYDILCKKYENNKFIINQHIQALVNLMPCKSETATDISNLIDEFQKNFRALSSLKPTENHGQLILCYLLQTKLDQKTRTEWELKMVNQDETTIEELIEFLSMRLRVLKTVEQTSSNKFSSSVKKDSSTNKYQFKNQSLIKPTHTLVSINQCHMCNENHGVYECKQFLDLSVSSREEKLKHFKLCYNCLRPGHSAFNCFSKSRCNKCQRKHNTLIHFEKVNNNLQCESIISKREEKQEVKNDQIPVTIVNSTRTDMSVMLSTVIINISDINGRLYPCRALLDSGSQSNFMTSELCQRLKLRKNKITVPVQGIAGAQLKVNNCVRAFIKSNNSEFCSELEFLLLTKIVDKIPVQHINIESMKIPPVRLADPNFNIPNKIDLLIGAEIFYDIILQQEKILVSNSLWLQNSEFGYIVTGKAKIKSSNLKNINCGVVQLSQNLDKLVQKFWEIDQFKCPSLAMSIEEKSCENEFIKTYTRNSEGRYIVKLPIKNTVCELGESKEQAVKRFNSVEKKLSKCPELKNQYCEFMKEYLELDHMELCKQSDDNKLHYFLPHHAVLRPESTTTKLRVVFDGSAKTTNGVSLNETLKVGPKVQQDLFQILLRFRKHQIAICGDVEKMYRQVLIHPDHHSFQSILWRFQPDQELKTYHLKTVTYGTTSAPYLATRALKQLALDDEKDYPLASKVVLNDFYVDDLLSGGESVNEVCELQEQVAQLLCHGGFKLHKWSSNSSEVLKNISIKSKTIINNNNIVKTLGVLWKTDLDCFSFLFSECDEYQTVTKRNILSEVAKIYDPLGLCAPVVFAAKLMIQKLWRMINISWDSVIEEPNKSNWNLFRSELPIINHINIDRCIFPKEKVKNIQLHGFCDASELGYGAVIYMRSETENSNYVVKLICAKSRVAPLKKQTLPRLELCGALLVAQLMEVVYNSLNLKHVKVLLWCDSTIVLSWITTPSSDLKTFVSNRVADIQQLNFEWRHIKTTENPADIVSRGLLPSQLADSNLWWNGPSFLVEKELLWPEEIDWKSSKFKSDSEYRSTEVVLLVESKNKNKNNNLNEVINLYSCYDKLLRVVALIVRFKNNVTINKKSKIVGVIKADEMQNAFGLLAKSVQSEYFYDEIKCLKNKTNISNNSKIKSLNPFIDKFGIIRVGGRLENSNLSYNQKHPIILSAEHKFTNMLVKYEHIRNLHCGPQALHAVVRQRVWMIGGRNLSKQIVHNCLICVKNKPKTIEQLMGQLPESRVTKFRAFLKTGIDFCGPVFIHHKVRGKAPTKAYISVFVCFATKAVHLELVGDLSTEAFLGALRRFISRRGRCAVIYSDNATNFIGANNQLKELRKLFFSQKHQEIIQKFVASEHIQWEFIPPRSPHFGGLWEAAVKSAKHYLNRATSKAIFTHDEYLTMLAQVEACLNSRPITPISENIDDMTCLTPGHFLIFDSLTSIVEPCYKDIPINRLSKWQHVQQIVQHFWSRWSKEYLTSLQQRGKWNNVVKNIKIGTFVLIKEDNIPSTKWLMGRVVEVHPGKDGLIRVVTLKTSNGLLQRSVVKLCPLPIENELMSLDLVK